MTTQKVPEWVQDAVFYQVFPDRFARSERLLKPTNLEPWDHPPTQYGFKGGDLLGIAEKLDYLVDLGITALYLNPIFQSAANHRYHTYDYYKVDPLLGGIEAFRALLRSCHQHGIRVVLDGVFNHTGRGFFQFHDLLENGRSSIYRDWFHVRGFPLDAYNCSPRQLHNYASWSDLPALPKLNTQTPAVREYLLGVAEHWTREGIDGWRLDDPAEIRDERFWQTLRGRVKAVNPEAYLVGEVWTAAQEWLRGDRFDAVMNYPLSRACLGFFGGAALDTSARPGGHRLRVLGARAFANRIDAMLGWYSWPIAVSQLNLIGSHDTPRTLTIFHGAKDRFKLALFYLMTSPGSPCIYYGDEIGLCGGSDPGCRASMPWDQSIWDHGLREHVRRSITLRHSHAALRRGDHTSLYAHRGVYVFGRRYHGETLLVAVNTNEHTARARVSTRSWVADGMVLIPVWDANGKELTTGRTVELHLNAMTGGVWQAEVASRV
jgi:glycosidase